MKQILPLVILIILLVPACGPGGSMELSPPQTLRLASGEGENHPLTKGLLEFSRLASERTHNTLMIQISPSKKLGEDRFVLDKLMKGEIDLACVSVLSLTNISKTFDVLSLPFLFNDENHFWQVLEGNTGTDLLKTLDKNEMKGLAFFDPGSLYFYSNRKELKTAADFKAAKIRIPQSLYLRQFVGKLGGFAAPMPADQIYNALKTNVIDIVENSLPEYWENAHFEVARYFLLLPSARIPSVLLISKKTLQKLPPAAGELLTNIAREAARFGRAELTKYETDALDKLQKQGVTVTKALNVKEFQVITGALGSDANDEGKKLIETIRGKR